MYDFALLYNYRLTSWQLVQCIIASFFDYKDITKDAFLLVKMTLSVGGAIFIEDLSSFAFLVSPKPSNVFIYVLSKSQRDFYIMTLTMYWAI